MRYQYTPATERALAAAAAWRNPQRDDELTAAAVLAGLLAEPETRAAEMLAARGISLSTVLEHWPLERQAAATKGRPHFAADFDSAIAEAIARVGEYLRPLNLATEHLLLGLATADGEVAQWLRLQGCDIAALETEIHRLYGYEPGPVDLEWDDDAPDEVESPSAPVVTSAGASQDVASTAKVSRQLVTQAIDGSDQRAAALRVLDAAANRVREGLRVAEDYVRFVLDDRHLTSLVKGLRHDLAAALAVLPAEALLACRDTVGDVGTSVSTDAEQSRPDCHAVAAAALKRAQEALRSLEEFGKVVDSNMATQFEQIRYRSYTFERTMRGMCHNAARLANTRLYVLIDGRRGAQDFGSLVQELIEAGVDCLQLRDKDLDDRELLVRARQLRELTRDTRTLFVMNDRPDLAVLAEADGIHVGQDELPVAAVRRIVGPQMMIGVSTHSLEQARQAVVDGADYLGVGPVFPSSTKTFGKFPGLELVRAVSAEIKLPAFAIGGITAENVASVLAAGVGRVAVANAIIGASSPREAVAKFRAALSASANAFCSPLAPRP
ncbi:MAG: thiamine phosphate synthase [Planctomycetes bacterium]|nr:thiamine phosphate synthase [Planctomycetota bacterium]